MLWKIWYTLPNGKSFNFTSRSCTSSLGLMALKQFHPDRVPDHPIVDGAGHRLLDYTLDTTLPAGCAVMVRHPVDRFRSVVTRMGISVEKALVLLYWFHGLGPKPATTDRHDLEYTHGTTWHHLTPVTQFIQPDSQLFVFPDIAGMAAYLGIVAPEEHINECPAVKPDLTPEQDAAVREIYAADLVLWESLQS
jgi:hypothetical protein